MLPTKIIKEAKAKKLDAIAICDHNSAENVLAVKKAAAKEGIFVLAGMEICTSEEVHILGFFDDDKALLEMQDTIYENLSGENDEKYFGEQLIVNESDKFIGITRKLLIGSTGLSVSEIVDLIHDQGGLAVASHVDRDAYSIIAQLGFIPKELPLDALEVSWRCGYDKISTFENSGYPIIRSSDAHYLEDIGKVFTNFLLEKLSFTEMAMAFRGTKGRTISI
jgi:predicted metal-dependent phosphoesterase TrpH